MIAYNPESASTETEYYDQIRVGDAILRRTPITLNGLADQDISAFTFTGELKSETPVEIPIDATGAPAGYVDWDISATVTDGVPVGLTHFFLRAVGPNGYESSILDVTYDFLAKQMD